MNSFTIDVATDFHPEPFGRHREEGGDASAEVFLERHLIPALRANEHVVVDLSGYDYYDSDFLEAVFGGLIRAGFSPDELGKKVKAIHNRLPSIELEASEYLSGLTPAEILGL